MLILNIVKNKPHTANMERLCDKLTKDENSRGHITRAVSKVVKPTKFTTWTKRDSCELLL